MSSTSVTPIKKPTAFELELQEYEGQIAAALPAHIPVDRFKRVIVTALNQNPGLYRADRRSLFIACIRAAQDGLLPDGREAALVVFKAKDKRSGERHEAVQYLPMVAGIIKRMRNSGEVAAVDTQLVYQKDEFVYRLGDDPKIEHKPALTDRGAPIAAYAIIKLTNGEVLREVMGRDDIEQVRAVSRSKDAGPWVTWWGEMARKTVLRRCAKRAPVSSDVDELLRREDEEAGSGEPRTLGVPVERPPREAFLTPLPDNFIFIAADGEELHFESAAHAEKAMVDALASAAKQGEAAVDGLWESNGYLLSQLRERDEGGRADALNTLYAETLDGLKKPAAEPPVAMPEPPSPLKRPRTDWAPRVAWIKEKLAAMSGEERAEYLQSDAEITFIEENRRADWEALEIFLDELRLKERDG